MAITLPPGLSALRECLKQLVPNLESNESGLGQFPLLTTSMPLYAAWASPPPNSQPYAPWSTPMPGSSTAYNPKQAFNDIVDYIPQVDYVYRPSSSTVSQAYGFILENLRFGTSSSPTPDVGGLYAKLADLGKRIQGLRSDMYTAYLQSAQYPATPFIAYMTSDPTFQQYQFVMEQLAQVSLLLREKLGTGGAIEDAVTEYNALINEATSPRPILPWRWGDMDVPGMIEGWRNGRGLNPQTVTAASKATTSTANEFIDKKSGGSGFLVDLIAGGGHGDFQDTRSLTSTDEELGIQLQVSAWAEVPVVINDVDAGGKKWYNATVLRAYNKDEYFRPPLSGASAGNSPAYGPKGEYPWRIASVIVAYQPAVKLTLGEKSYAQFDHVKQTTSHWSCGPFGLFGGGSSVHRSETHTVNTDAQSRSIEIADKSLYPVILGMVMEQVP